MHFLCQRFFRNRASQSLPPKIYESRYGRGELTARGLSHSVSFFLHMLRKVFFWKLYGQTICLNGENEVTFRSFVSLVNFVTVLILNTHIDFCGGKARTLASTEGFIYLCVGLLVSRGLLRKSLRLEMGKKMRENLRKRSAVRVE